MHDCCFISRPLFFFINYYYKLIDTKEVFELNMKIPLRKESREREKLLKNLKHIAP